jgi:hypothetical protein
MRSFEQNHFCTFAITIWPEQWLIGFSRPEENTSFANFAACVKTTIAENAINRRTGRT